MRTILVFAVASLAAAFATTSAYAVKRGCNAQVYLKKGTLVLPLDDFSARGYDTRSANDARRMAVRKAKKCAVMARDLRWERRKPADCKPGASVYDYGIDSLKDKIERTACDYNRTKGTFEVRLKTWGGKRCKGDLHFMNYDMTADMCR